MLVDFGVWVPLGSVLRSGLERILLNAHISVFWLCVYANGCPAALFVRLCVGVYVRQMICAPWDAQTRTALIHNTHKK
jgi:hypothetical protein